MSEACVLYANELSAYSFPEPHPFGRDRLPAFWKEFLSRKLDQQVAIEGPEDCDDSALDTPAFPGVFEISRLVVGTTLKAIRLAMSGKYARVFSPMGGLHHARRDRAGGFCVFNDIGVAIETLRKEHGIQRIGYVDIDAHHGDGVYYGFETDPELPIGDIHEDGTFLYPGTGSKAEIGKGAARGTHLRYSPQCHAEAARRVRALAEKHARGRMIALGGGGYTLPNLAQAWCGVVEELIRPASATRRVA